MTQNWGRGDRGVEKTAGVRWPVRAKLRGTVRTASPPGHTRHPVTLVPVCQGRLPCGASSSAFCWVQQGRPQQKLGDGGPCRWVVSRAQPAALSFVQLFPRLLSARQFVLLEHLLCAGTLAHPDSPGRCSGCAHVTSDLDSSYPCYQVRRSQSRGGTHTCQSPVTVLPFASPASSSPLATAPPCPRVVVSELTDTSPKGFCS